MTQQTTVLDLTSEISKTTDVPSAKGGFAEVWKCKRIHGGRREIIHVEVAVKVVRARQEDGGKDRIQGSWAKEKEIWHSLHHPNVIPLLGTVSGFGVGTELSLVAPWIEGGTLRELVHTKREQLAWTDSQGILLDIAAGLSYLHRRSIIHGDLSSNNILINQDLRGLITDFGMAYTLEDVALGPSRIYSGTVRWAAPEHFQYVPGVEPNITLASDVYSYGSIMLEVLSGDWPYASLKTEVQVVLKLSKGESPERPTCARIADEQWEFMTRCWRVDPGSRPSAQTVYSNIRDL